MAACSPPGALREEDSIQGRRQIAPTIVSLNPCTDAILAEVAAPGQLLAISHYSQDPRATSMDIDIARQFRATGGTVEEVLALSPDIVVGSNFIAPATRQALEDLDIELVTFGVASTVEESQQQIRQLAALAGQSGRGEELIAHVDRALSALGEAGPVSAVLWQPAGIVPGEETLIGDLMRRAGFTSHSAAMGLRQADYLSLEQMLANPPQVLLLAGQERSQQHPALEHLADTRTARLDPSLLYCGGPTIIRASERLKEIREARP